MKVIGIVKNNCITGVEYGLVEIPDREIANIKNAQPRKKRKKNNSKKIKNNKKHNSVKNARKKTDCVEKETKIASKKPKRRYHIHATIVCSYNFKTSKKSVDLTKKRFKKNKDLFKKKQRKNKIELQNIVNKMDIIVPIFDLLQLIDKEKQRTK